MFCESCGSFIPDGDTFCSNCGAQITYSDSASTPAAAPGPDAAKPESSQSAFQQPTYQQPTYQQPAYQQPAYQQPVYQQPVYQQPIYQQPVYQQPAYTQSYVSQVPRERTRINGFATSGLIFGILALVTSWIPIIDLFPAFFGLLFSVLGVVRKNASGKGRAIAGLIMSGIGGLVGIIILIAFISDSYY